MRRLEKININEIMYIIFAIYMLDLLLGFTVLPKTYATLDIILKLLRYVSYIAFITKILIDLKHDKKITISIILLSIVALIVVIFSKNKSIIFLFLALMASRKLKKNKLLKIIYYIFFVTYIIIIALALLNIIPDWTFKRGNTIRHSLGYIYATDCIGIYLAIIFMYAFLKKSKANLLEIMSLELINIFLYKYTDGRLSFILISILLCMLVLSKISIIKKLFNSKETQKIIKIICYSLPIIMFIAYNCLTYAYSQNSGIAKKIDKLLSSRLKYTAQAYETYGVPIFGKNIEWHGWGGYGYTNLDKMDEFEYNFVDSSYARLIFDYGIVFSLIVILMYTYILIKNFNKRNYWTVFLLILVLIWSFIEPYIINLGRNPLTLLLVPIFELGAIDLKNINIKNKGQRYLKDRKNEQINN